MHPYSSPRDVTAREIVIKDNLFLAYLAFRKVTVQVQSRQVKPFAPQVTNLREEIYYGAYA